MRQRKQAGFTLLELLIVMVIMGFVSMMIARSYVHITSVMERNQQMRLLQQSSNFVLARLADMIRAYSIDYTAYAAASTSRCQGQTLAGTQSLCLTNGDIIWGQQFDALSDAEGFLRYDRVIDDMSGDFLTAELLPLGVIVERLEFRVSPDENPYATTEVFKKTHPKVTVLLTLRHQQDSSLVLSLQTTLSSRRYQP